MRIRGGLPPRGPPLMDLPGPIHPRELISVPTGEEGLEGLPKRSVKVACLDAVSTREQFSLATILSS